MGEEVAVQKNALEVIKAFIDSSGLQDIEVSFNSKTKTASVTGLRDGYQFTTIIHKEKKSNKEKFGDNVNFSRDALIWQIKKLRENNLTQKRIADMLGISQSLVSKYDRL